MVRIPNSMGSLSKSHPSPCSICSSVIWSGPSNVSAHVGRGVFLNCSRIVFFSTSLDTVNVSMGSKHSRKTFYFRERKRESGQYPNPSRDSRKRDTFTRAQVAAWSLGTTRPRAFQRQVSAPLSGRLRQVKWGTPEGVPVRSG